MIQDNIFEKSEQMLERVLKSIPLGSQTFSKSKTQYPFGVSPFFMQSGKGSHVTDVDGNEFIDFMNSLGAITLGYNDEDVINAVKNQLEEGTIFSLPHPTEHMLAEKLIELIPSAEMVRFGKNGSDATSGIVRLARAYTKRDYVVVCGYHGWQDWYIGSTPRNLGVPKCVQELTLKFEYNNIESLDKLFKEYKDQIACVIMEPMNFSHPKKGFLEEVKELTHKNSALLAFDEMITGFRYSLGGAQEFFNVIPDLASFGKGMANGYPISAVVGRADVMQLLEEVFFSFTFGGECLSLAASIATIEKFQKYPVIEHMKKQGSKILDKVSTLITEHELNDIFEINGQPCWTIFNMKDTEQYNSWTIKTLFMQEMIKRGILTLGINLITYSHTDEDIEKLLNAYTEVMPILQNGIRNNKILDLLDCEPLTPLFKTR